MARSLALRYCRPMTAEDVKALPVDTKIQIMEAMWEDLRDRFDRMEISQEQKDILDRRRARVRDGEDLRGKRTIENMETNIQYRTRNVQ